MEKKVLSGMMLTLLLMGMLTLAFSIQPVQAGGTIYIRPDGSVDPPAAPIQRDEDLYTLTDDIFCDIDGIVIERNNMTLDGADHTLQGSGAWYSKGASLSGRSNVTIKDLTIKEFTAGIQLDTASNNDFYGNNVTNNKWWGINLYESSNNNILRNNVTDNEEDGISLDMSSSNNSIYGNNVASNWYGIRLWYSPDNSISENNVTSNEYGIYIRQSSNNIFHHNNFVNNLCQVCMYASMPGETPPINVWDDGYPSGGNYWRDHVTVDDYSGINQDEPGSDGIVDEPYIIDDYNCDNYPLVEPWSPLPTTIGELKIEIEECGLEGEINNQGIVRSLIAKLNVAQKLVNKGKIDEAKSILEDDFIPQVQNLSGIHITVENTDNLIQSAEYILSQL